MFSSLYCVRAWKYTSSTVFVFAARCVVAAAAAAAAAVRVLFERCV